MFLRTDSHFDKRSLDIFLGYKNPIRFGSMGEPEYVIGGSQGAHTVELMKHVGYSDKEIEEAIASGAATGETKLKKL